MSLLSVKEETCKDLSVSKELKDKFERQDKFIENLCFKKEQVLYLIGGFFERDKGTKHVLYGSYYIKFCFDGFLDYIVKNIDNEDIGKINSFGSDVYLILKEDIKKD